MKNESAGVGTKRIDSSASGPAPVVRAGHDRIWLPALAMLAGVALFWGHAHARDFPAVIDLGNLDPADGFLLDGENLGDYSGVSVSAAGDVNGDDIDDFIVGAYRANPDGVAEVGRTFVLFGSTDGFPQELRLSDLNGNIGFMIDGEAGEDRSGISVAGVGDFNADGIDDILIGARDADPNGDRSGSSYIVFGSNSGFDSPFSLGNLHVSEGFRLDGEASQDRSGGVVAAAGDVNGDGVADVIIGADGQDANGNFDSGRSYVVFGGGGAFSSVERLSPAFLDGGRGFSISGENILDSSAFSVDGAGDVNGDGYDDLIVGAYLAPSTAREGRTYVLFGKATDFDPDVLLANLDGANGFRLDGPQDSESGFSVSGAGDVNGDGIDDLIIGAPGASLNGSESGSAYVVFGTSTGFPAAISLDSLDVSDGFRLVGGSSFDQAGFSVDGAGDINGDGIDDLIVGAPSPNSSTEAGRSYVVFGRSNGFPEDLQLSSLDGTDGFRLEGENAADSAGISVRAAGDVNGDGIPDLVIGAYGNDANGLTDSGRSYVVFGRSTSTGGDDTTGLFVDGFEPGT